MEGMAEIGASRPVRVGPPSSLGKPGRVKVLAPGRATTPFAQCACVGPAKAATGLAEGPARAVAVRQGPPMGLSAVAKTTPLTTAIGAARSGVGGRWAVTKGPA